MPHRLRTAAVTTLVPRVLHAAVARLDGPSSEIIWDRHRLIHRSWRGEDPSPPLSALHVPSQEAWERFWNALEATGAWEWAGRYDAPSSQASSGPGWLLRIHHGERSLHASGAGAFPDGRPGHPGPAFRHLCRELALLAGRRPIG